MQNIPNIPDKAQAVDAFRRYARLGLCKCELNPIQIYRRIDALCQSRRQRLDMLAVLDTLRFLYLKGDVMTLSALGDTYFSRSMRSARRKRGELSGLVRAHARRCFCDERTVYRRLEGARRLFVFFREREGELADGVSFPQEHSFLYGKKP